MPLGLFVKKLQPKVGLGGYYILFAYFVVEAKIKRNKTGSPDSYFYVVSISSIPSIYLIYISNILGYK